MTHFFVALALALPLHFASADPGADPNTEDALRDTKSLLVDPSRRGAEIEKNRDAQKADELVKRTAPGNAQAQQSIYEVTSEVMEGLVRKSNGDPVALQEAVQKLQADPQSLRQHLTPDQRKKIEELSRELASDPTRSANPH